MKLNYKRTFFIGFAFLSICAFWQLYDSIVPLILKNTFKIGDTVAGAVMAADNVMALFLLPLFGALSDKVKTPIGKRMPFIIGGTAMAVVFMILLPVSDNKVNLPMFIIALFLTLVAMGTYRSPAVALMPDLTPKPLRSKANAIINLMGAVGGMVSLVLISFLVKKVDKPNYLPLFACIAALMVLAVVILIFTVNENKLLHTIEGLDREEPKNEEEKTTSESSKLPKDVFRSLAFILVSISFWFMAYNAVTTAFSKYAQDFLKLEGGGFAGKMLLATAAAIITYIPSGLIASKIGRKKTIMLGILLMFVCFSLAFTYTEYKPSMNILLVFIGVGWALINVNSYPMVVEMSKGSDIGKYTGYYYTFSMAAQILTPILSGALLEFVGYRTLFPYAAVFMALAFLTMTAVRHGDSKPVPPKDKLTMPDGLD
ncbi:MAG: MFS transporter [Clostridia bacterium]|jgi:maltose/moltooligosaccharide transporter